METAKKQDTKIRNQQLERYYRGHSLIYDWTRWSFLFGREKLLEFIPDLPPNPRILEIGCGTGQNLLRLEHHFPDAGIYGIDLSADMIRQARKKVDGEPQVKLINGAYGSNEFQFEPFDLILLSYSLSMLGSQVEDILQQICNDLEPGGSIAVVDFNRTPFNWFHKWMKVNHVDLDGHLPGLLNKYFEANIFIEQNAYIGMWTYIHFLGKRQ